MHTFFKSSLYSLLMGIILMANQAIAQPLPQTYLKPTQTLDSLPDTLQLTYMDDNLGINSSVNWQKKGNNYSLSMNIAIPLRNLQYTSTGIITQEGLQPVEFEELRGGYPYRKASFDWTGTSTLTFGTPSDKTTVPLQKGAQDILSMLWQQAINEPKATQQIQVTNGKKVYHYTTETTALTDLKTEEGIFRVRHLTAQEGDTSIEVWFASDFHFLPVRIAFNKPDETPLELQLIHLSQNKTLLWKRQNEGKITPQNLFDKTTIRNRNR